MEKNNKQASPYYICDVCGGKIKNLNEAILQWSSKSLWDATNFRIVHAGECEEDLPSMSDIRIGNSQDQIESIVMKLLGIIADYLDYIDEKFPDKEYNLTEDILEVIKRLVITDYETVRNHIDEAIQNGIIEENTRHTYLEPYQIRHIQHYLENNNKSSN